ncbi:hypothetical protein BGY98DRAFT_1050537, partial [Russula aff. rugulosa BPL654]
GCSVGSLNECGWWFFIGGIVGGGTVHGPGRQFNQWNWGEITVFEGRLARVLSGCSRMSVLVVVHVHTITLQGPLVQILIIIMIDKFHSFRVRGSSFVHQPCVMTWSIGTGFYVYSFWLITSVEHINVRYMARVWANPGVGR